MVTKQLDSRARDFKTIPISYLIQTANQFECDIYVTSDKHTANAKRYDEMKMLRMGGFLTFIFKGSDEAEAENRIQRILWQDN